MRAPGHATSIVEIAAAGLCHSDLSYMHGLYPVPSPGVCGHEGAGIVAEVGAAVTHVKPGDHVMHRHRRQLRLLRARAPTAVPRCAARRSPTASRPFTLDGEPISNFAATSAFAERTVVRDIQCVKIPDDVPLTTAAIVGCGVVTGMGAVFNRANVQRGQTRRRVRRRWRRPQRDPGAEGAGRDARSSPSTPSPTKEALAKQFGATHFVDGTRDDIVDADRRRSRRGRRDRPRGAFNGGGVNWAFDCVANPQVT